MFTYEEKLYLLQLLKKEGRKSWFRKPSKKHEQLRQKLEQMIRNEHVNRHEL